MALQFVFVGVLLASLGTALVIVVRALPRVDGTIARRSMFERWITSEFPERLDAFFRTFYLRGLRKTKIAVLKLDNMLNRKMESLKLERGEGIRSGSDRPGFEVLSQEGKE